MYSITGFGVLNGKSFLMHYKKLILFPAKNWVFSHSLCHHSSLSPTHVPLRSFHTITRWGRIVHISTTNNLTFRFMENNNWKFHSRFRSCLCSRSLSTPFFACRLWRIPHHFNSPGEFCRRVQASDNGNVTISILSFTPTREDNGKVLICRAINEVMKHSIKETTLKLNIYCEYIHNIYDMLFSFIGATAKLRLQYTHNICIQIGLVGRDFEAATDTQWWYVDDDPFLWNAGWIKLMK